MDEIDKSVKCTGVGCHVRVDCFRYMSKQKMPRKYGPFDLIWKEGTCNHYVKIEEEMNHE